MTIITSLLDVYSCLAKAQHGVSKVNQLPWQYYERIQHLLNKELQKITEGTYDGVLKKNEGKLKEGLLANNSTIVTEPPRRSNQYNIDKSCTEQVVDGKETVIKFVEILMSSLKERISEDGVVKIMKEVFHDWKDEELPMLVEITNSSGRDYGDTDKLTEEYKSTKY